MASFPTLNPLGRTENNVIIGHGATRDGSFPRLMKGRSHVADGVARLVARPGRLCRGRARRRDRRARCEAPLRALLGSPVARAARFPVDHRFGRPPTRVATSGRPAAMASRVTRPSDSLRLGIATTSATASQSPTSSRWPRKWTGTRECPASRRNHPSSGPFPMTSKWTSVEATDVVEGPDSSRAFLPPQPGHDADDARRLGDLERMARRGDVCRRDGLGLRHPLAATSMRSGSVRSSAAARRRMSRWTQSSDRPGVRQAGSRSAVGPATVMVSCGRRRRRGAAARREPSGDRGHRFIALEDVRM